MDRKEIVGLIENELIPNYLVTKKNKSKTDEYYFSIRLSAIKKLGLNYEDTLFAINYLGDNGIRVTSMGSSEFDSCDNVDVITNDFIKRSKSNGNSDTLANIKKYRETKDRDLLNKIITDNMGLVNYIYAREGYYSLDLDKNELIQSGLIALMVAINTFDFDNGASFGTYAYRCIDNKMARCALVCSNLHTRDSNLFYIINDLESNDVFYDKHDIVDEIINIVNSNEELSNKYNSRRLELRLLLEKYRDSLEEVFEIDDDYCNDGHIRSIFSEHGKDSFDEFNSYYDELEAKEVRNLFDNIFEELKPSEVYALKEYFGWDDYNPKTYEEIGENMNLTRQAVCSKNARTLKKIIKNHGEEIEKYK